VFERALERGLEDLCEDLVLAPYLEGDPDREEAIERVGRRKSSVRSESVRSSRKTSTGA